MRWLIGMLTFTSSLNGLVGAAPGTSVYMEGSTLSSLNVRLSVRMLSTRSSSQSVISRRTLASTARVRGNAPRYAARPVGASLASENSEFHRFAMMVEELDELE